jgi:hypothetical protein
MKWDEPTSMAEMISMRSRWGAMRISFFVNSGWQKQSNKQSVSPETTIRKTFKREEGGLCILYGVHPGWGWGWCQSITAVLLLPLLALVVLAVCHPRLGLTLVDRGLGRMVTLDVDDGIRCMWSRMALIFSWQDVCVRPEAFTHTLGYANPLKNLQPSLTAIPIKPTDWTVADLFTNRPTLPSMGRWQLPPHPV